MTSKIRDWLKGNIQRQYDEHDQTRQGMQEQQLQSIQLAEKDQDKQKQEDGKLSIRILQESDNYDFQAEPDQNRSNEQVNQIHGLLKLSDEQRQQQYKSIIVLIQDNARKQPLDPQYLEMQFLENQQQQVLNPIAVLEQQPQLLNVQQEDLDSKSLILIGMIVLFLSPILALLNLGRKIGLIPRQ